jgi:hypothetical protein|nr:MAG TPA: hypothetical protein [Caudoviricetes sp.]
MRIRLKIGIWWQPTDDGGEVLRKLGDVFDAHPLDAARLIGSGVAEDANVKHDKVESINLGLPTVPPADDDDSGDSDSDPTNNDKRPALAAKVELWRQYVASLGASEKDIKGLTKPELIAMADKLS